MRHSSTCSGARDFWFARGDHLAQLAARLTGDRLAFAEGNPHVRQRLPGEVAAQRVGCGVPHDTPPVPVAGVEPQRQSVGSVLDDLEMMDAR